MALSDADDALAAHVRAMFAREGARCARRGEAREGARAPLDGFGADARIARTCGAAVCAALRGACPGWVRALRAVRAFGVSLTRLRRDDDGATGTKIEYG